MRCEEAREAATAARYADAGDPELDAHLADCADCRAHAAQHARLDRALALDEPVLPGPGFDTRFFARLDVERSAARSKRARRFVWLLVPAVAATAAALVLLRAAQPSPPGAMLT